MQVSVGQPCVHPTHLELNLDGHSHGVFIDFIDENNTEIDVDIGATQLYVWVLRVVNAITKVNDGAAQFI